MNRLLEFVDDVRFTMRNPRSKSGWSSYSPRQLETVHLVHKTRYHMKQMLACLLELKKREGVEHKDKSKNVGASVCTILSQKLTEYKTCNVKLTEHGVKLMVNMERKDA